MSTEEHKAIVRRFVEDVLSQGNLAAADELLDPNFVLRHAGIPEPIRSAEYFKQYTSALRSSFPDIRAALEDVIAEGDRVAVRLTWHGTHQGAFQGIPPTGRSFTVTGMAAYRLAGSKITEAWAELDMLGMLQQLGVVPAPGQTGG